MLRHSAYLVRLLRQPIPPDILDNDTAPCLFGSVGVLWNTADMSTTILPPSFASDFQMIYPYFGLQHLATTPPSFERFDHGLRILAHAGIRDRAGMQHIAANLLSMRLGEHRHIGHSQVQRFRISSPLFDICKQHGVLLHLYEVFRGGFYAIDPLEVGLVVEFGALSQQQPWQDWPRRFHRSYPFLNSAVHQHDREIGPYRPTTTYSTNTRYDGCPWCRVEP